MTSIFDGPVVIIEPHFDDAWLSLGGLLLQANVPITIITLTWHKKGVDTALSVLKDALPRLDYQILRWKSLPIYRFAIYRLMLRYWAFSPESLFLRMNHLHDFHPVLEDIRPAVDLSTTCLFPLGLWHPMHWVTASLGCLASPSQARTGYYLDLPYGVYRSTQPDVIRSEALMNTETITIEAWLSKKMALIERAYPWALKYCALPGMQQPIDKVTSERVYFGGHPCRPKQFSYTLCKSLSTRTGCW